MDASPLSPGGPGGVGDFTSRERTISISPPIMLSTAGAVGLRSLSPSSPTNEHSSPQRNFSGIVLEDRVKDTAEILKDVVKGLHEGERVPDASPSRRMMSLEKGDEEADHKVRKAITEANERLTENAENLCKDNLTSHFKILGLRNAVNLVPKLMVENKHLKEEILRARLSLPEDVQRDLIRIEEAKRSYLSDQQARSIEEAASKQRLKDALEALRTGGFPDQDLVSFVSAALDSAIGVVFRTEDQRSKVETDLSQTKSENESLREKLAASREDHHLLQCKAEKLNTAAQEHIKTTINNKAERTTLEQQLQAAAAAISGLKDQLAGLQAELEVSTTEKTAALMTIKSLKDGLNTSREADDEEMTRLRNRYKSQLEEVEEDSKKSLRILTERLEGERKHAEELEKKWRASEDRALAAETETRRHRADTVHNEKEIASLTDLLATRDAQLAEASKKLSAEKDQNSELKDEVRELKQLLNASVETAETDRRIATQLRELSEKNSEDIKSLEDEVAKMSRQLVEAELTTAKHEASESEIRRRAEDAEEARLLAVSSLEDMGNRATEMEALYDNAIVAAQKEQQTLEAEKDRCLAEALERLEMVNALQAEKESLNAALEEKKETLTRLEGAEEKLETAMKLQEEAAACKEKAERGNMANEDAVQRMEEACKEFERKVRNDCEGKLEEKNEKILKYEEKLKEEAERTARTEDRMQQCLGRLKTVENQRIEESEAHKTKATELTNKFVETERRYRDLQAKLQDHREDGRYAKKNAKSVGWILAGRGALLRDLHKLHLMMANIQGPSQAKELSNHIMTTHLFECERRHLGMAPTEGAEGGRESSPRAPSPRQSWRLFNHSPAARPQDPPVPTDYFRSQSGDSKRPKPSPGDPTRTSGVTSPPIKSLEYW
eukprot:TRINITY_DN489_c2_g1_i1.p1 TRINITY_DN489_c2_g1~~TRINITY_DN489_c2_g1_i1.p1  ORF type:complete len:901 (+),score=203.88 TRINITY_DN489_c2_g1_i1:56-2758(+)